MTSYCSTLDKYVFPHGTYTCREMEYFDHVRCEWENSLPEYSRRELIKIFPESKKILIKSIEEESIQCRKDLNLADALIQEYESIVYQKCSKGSEQFWREVYLACFINPLRENREKTLRKNGFFIQSITQKKKIMSSASVTEREIEYARMYPISDLVHFNRGNKAQCIWCMDKGEDDMHHYKKDNHVYCFGCTAKGDAIDVYMKLYGCNFVTAVKALS